LKETEVEVEVEAKAEEEVKGLGFDQRNSLNSYTKTHTQRYTWTALA